MKCLLCKSNVEMINDFTTHVAELDKGIVIIKNVPYMKCPQCGETVYSGDVIIKIEAIIDKCRDILTEIAIVDYKDMAA